MNTLSGTTQIETGIKMIWSLVKMRHIESIDRKKSNNPLLRVYFDSNLGSPVEQAVEQAYATSIYETIKNKLPDWEIAKDAAKILGNSLGKLSVKALDITKLNYKYFKGQINTIQYRYEITKRTLCTVATIIDKGWVFMESITKKGSKATLVFLGMDANSAEYVAEKVYSGLSAVIPYIVDKLKSEKAITFVSEGVQKVAAGAKKLVDIAGEKVPQLVTKIAEAIEKPVEKVVNFAKSSYETIVESGKKAGNWLKNRWNKVKSLW